MEHVKRYTTIGTAHDQGKTSGVVASGITSELLGVPIQTSGRHHVPRRRTRRWRSPRSPAAAEAGCSIPNGSPRCTTGTSPAARCSRTSDSGSARATTRCAGEDMDAAVLRECAAVRGGVGILDGSTLGKIDVQGPDAGRVPRHALHEHDEHPEGRHGPLRRDVRRRRHGHRRRHRDAAGRRPVPGVHHHRRRRADPGLDGGMAADRVAAPAGAADLGHRAVAHLPRRRAPSRATSSARSSATSTSATRRSRSWPGATPPSTACTSGSAGSASPANWPTRSTSPGWYATAVWERLIAAGERHGITPYGTETMHVLRAEKGYPIIGQDTDGTVTPQDLGMSWAVSKKKPDFIGKRSFTRSENLNPLRKQFVGLLPVDAQTVLPGGRTDHRARRRRRTAAGARSDARARHLELSQRRTGSPVRTGPRQGRPRPHRRHPDTSRWTEDWWPWRSPAPSSSIPKEHVAMADTLTRQSPLQGWEYALRVTCPKQRESARSHSSRWSTCGSTRVRRWRSSRRGARGRSAADDSVDRHRQPGRQRDLVRAAGMVDQLHQPGR